ncbi:MAG: transposase [Proteobacteria bacterium]|nr:transposase [Pseudomonadota bacterium]MBU4275410.1 transposase [Pseudomonadota bacterium]MBU4382687.1 transposase [Pseudomonadota bacterium]MBU4606389.1 transposase [Pseudomonadota bacterium]
MRYRRILIPGGTYFFTIVTHSRIPVFSSSRSVDLLRNVFRQVKERHPFVIDAIVILPDHIHCVLTMPDEDLDYPLRIGLIKSDFARRFALAGPKGKADTNPVWQRRYWEHLMRNENDYTKHVEYIHYNPVKHGLVKSPKDWPWSSFNDYVAKGVYDVNWGAGEVINFEAEVGAE